MKLIRATCVHACVYVCACACVYVCKNKTEKKAIQQKQLKTEKNNLFVAFISLYKFVFFHLKISPTGIKEILGNATHGSIYLPFVVVSPGHSLRDLT